jgi:hypothetical protein
MGITAGPAQGAPVDWGLAPVTSSAPVALMAYAADASSPYSSLYAALPSLPPVIAGLDVPGVLDVFNNVTGFLPWDYAFGLTLGNAGGLGIQAWAPTNPLFDFVAESVGTTSGAWPGVASLVGIETAMGGFTNTESYGNYFDPTGTTCLICDTFSLLGPANTNLFSWTSDIPIGGLPQFELTTPLGSFGPALGNAFDVSPLANGLGAAARALSSLVIAGVPAPTPSALPNVAANAVTINTSTPTALAPHVAANTVTVNAPKTPNTGPVGAPSATGANADPVAKVTTLKVIATTATTGTTDLTGGDKVAPGNGTKTAGGPVGSTVSKIAAGLNGGSGHLPTHGK